MGCAGEDHGAGQKRGATAQELDQAGHVEDKVVTAPVLHDLSVEHGAYLQRGRIGDLVLEHQAGPHWREGIEGLSTAPLAATALYLPVAGAHVVGTGVTQHIVERVFPLHILAAFGDHDREFTFVIHLVTAKTARQDDWVAGMLHRGGRFHKQHGKLRDRRVALLGVAAVVQTDAEKIYRLNGCEQFVRPDGFTGYAELTIDVARDAPGAAVRLQSGVMDESGGVLVADDFHKLPGWNYRVGWNGVVRRSAVVQYPLGGPDRVQLQRLLGFGAEFFEETGVAGLLQILVAGRNHFLQAGAACR